MIIQTITDEWHFAEWCKQAQARDSDYGHFTVEGAKAVQAWFDELSEGTGENVEFDPIAWCVEFTEFETINEAFEQHHGAYEPELSDDQGNRTPEQQLEWFQDNTTVIELDNGHVIIREF